MEKCVSTLTCFFIGTMGINFLLYGIILKMKHDNVCKISWFLGRKRASVRNWTALEGELLLYKVSRACSRVIKILSPAWVWNMAGGMMNGLWWMNAFKSKVLKYMKVYKYWSKTNGLQVYRTKRLGQIYHFYEAWLVYFWLLMDLRQTDEPIWSWILKKM